MSTLSRFFVTMFGALLSFASHAALITYTFTGIASGLLNDNSFSNQAFTIVIRGDTANVSTSIFNSGTPAIKLALTNTITIGALLSGSISDGGLYVFNNQTIQTVGFGSNNHADLIDLGPDSSLATYDLASSFGPIGDPTPFFNQFTSVELLGGQVLSLSNLSDAAFTAVTDGTSIPEPATLALLGFGLAAAGLSRRKSEH